MVARRVPRLLLLTVLAAVVTACRPEIDVLLETTVYPDGSADRAIEITGRTAEGERPVEQDWLAEEGRVELARPDGWARVEREPGRLRAEGFFVPGAALPGTLAHLEGDARTADRNRVEIDVQDLAVATRWTYREVYGDPYGRDAAVRAVDGLLDLAVEAVEGELRASFGDRADAGAAAGRLRTEGRALALEILEAYRLAPGPDHRAQREAMLRAILDQRGIVGSASDEESFWEVRAAPVRAWLADLLAAGASTPEHPVRPEDLSFLPADPRDEAAWNDFAERTWGGTEALWERARPWIEALEGFYGGEESGRYRFEASVTLPGTLLVTNGAPVRGGAVWFFRGEDLFSGDRVLVAESVEPVDEALRALGARRSFDTPDLLRLRDLLVDRDPRGWLLEEVRAAVAAGTLERLRDAELVREDVLERAAELARLLDPESDGGSR